MLQHLLFNLKMEPMTVNSDKLFYTFGTVGSSELASGCLFLFFSYLEILEKKKKGLLTRAAYDINILFEFCSYKTVMCFMRGLNAHAVNINKCNCSLSDTTMNALFIRSCTATESHTDSGQERPCTSSESSTHSQSPNALSSMVS